MKCGCANKKCVLWLKVSLILEERGGERRRERKEEGEEREEGEGEGERERREREVERERRGISCNKLWQVFTICTVMSKLKITLVIETHHEVPLDLFHIQLINSTEIKPHTLPSQFPYSFLYL
jgi:hypothetical protein